MYVLVLLKHVGSIFIKKSRWLVLKLYRSVVSKFSFRNKANSLIIQPRKINM